MDATKRLREEIYYARRELLKRDFPKADLTLEMSYDFLQKIRAEARHNGCLSLRVSLKTRTDLFEGYEVIIKNDAVGFNIIHKN